MVHVVAPVGGACAFREKVSTATVDPWLEVVGRTHLVGRGVGVFVDLCMARTGCTFRLCQSWVVVGFVRLWVWAWAVMDAGFRSLLSLRRVRLVRTPRHPHCHLYLLDFP
jgi:hypothetical protein